jgi:hypothetical protein
MKKVFFLALSFTMFVSVSLYASNARLLSLNNPTFSHTAAVPASNLPNLLFPGDEYGMGISAVPDTLDIWKFPQTLVDQDLYPSTTVLFYFLSPENFSAGIVTGLGNLPLALGVFGMRPDGNGWVTGAPRSDLEGLGSDYAEDAGNAISTNSTPPGVPDNIVDLLLALKLGMFSIGIGGGFSYDIARWYSDEITGTSDSDTNKKSYSWAVPVRLGAGLDLNPIFPLSVDLCGLLLFSRYNATYKSEAAATPLPSEDDSVTANNICWSAGGRITWTLASKLDLIIIGEFARMSQDYEATDNGSSLDTATTRIDPASFFSINYGLGLNWALRANLFMNALFTATYGGGHWNADAPLPGPRGKGNDANWWTFRGVIDGELDLTSRLILRGGIGAAYRHYFPTLINVGTSSEGIIPSASAGMGFLITDKITLDLGAQFQDLTARDTFGSATVAASLEASL